MAWARGSNQYQKRLKPLTNMAQVSLGREAAGDTHILMMEWDPGAVDVDLIEETTTDRSRIRFRGQMPEFIWNAAALEGNTYTLPEVRTLLDGVSVGGKRIEETEQILALKDAHHLLDEMVSTGAFRLDKATSDTLHKAVARHEALDAGMFRGEGTVTGGGVVTTSTGVKVESLPHGKQLLEAHDAILEYLDRHVLDPRLQALVYFASATRHQFYFDGNKRTARLMMVGHLMARGYETVSVPNARRLEFNQALDTLFLKQDGTDLLSFLTTCSAP